MSTTIQEVRAADRPWDLTKIRILVEGEATVTVTDAAGNTFDELREGLSAYDARERAYETGNTDLVLDVIQLENAVKSIRDVGVRAAMEDVIAGVEPWELVDASGRGRASHLLVERGVELIRRHERGRLSERQRIGKTGNEPVCFRCMTRRVSMAGTLCAEDCDGLSRPERARLANLRQGPAQAPYDVTVRPNPARMSRASVSAELHHLILTQEDGDLPVREIDDHTESLRGRVG